MTYDQLMAVHLATIAPAFVLGTVLLVIRKGTAVHKIIGKAYMILMLVTGIVTLGMPARVGPTLFHHFGFLHLFSVLTLWSVPAAWLAIRRGDVKSHRANMIGLYVGGILIAGTLAFLPGRFLGRLIFQSDHITIQVGSRQESGGLSGYGYSSPPGRSSVDLRSPWSFSEPAAMP